MNAAMQTEDGIYVVHPTKDTRTIAGYRAKNGGPAKARLGQVAYAVVSGRAVKTLMVLERHKLSDMIPAPQASALIEPQYAEAGAEVYLVPNSAAKARQWA